MVTATHHKIRKQAGTNDSTVDRVSWYGHNPLL